MKIDKKRIEWKARSILEKIVLYHNVRIVENVFSTLNNDGLFA